MVFDFDLLDNIFKNADGTISEAFTDRSEAVGLLRSAITELTEQLAKQESRLAEDDSKLSELQRKNAELNVRLYDMTRGEVEEEKEEEVISDTAKQLLEALD
jgi:hypothetical protein